MTYKLIMPEVRDSIVGLHVKRVILRDAEKVWEKNSKPVMETLEEWLELGHKTRIK